MEIKVNELPDDQLKQIADNVGEQVISYFEKRDKITKDKALHNTKLLLRNYNKLQAHCRVVEDQLEEDEGTFWNHRFLNLDSLMQNKAKTVKIMNQVDRALEHYKRDCLKAKTMNESRRYDMLKMKYLNRDYSSDDDIADRYDVARTTVNRNVESAIEELSIILFGIEAFINH